MRKVICYIAASMDGYIARSDGAVDWLDNYMDVDYGYTAFMSSVDTVIMGHRTYLKSLDFGPQAFGGDHSYYVMTRSGGDVARDLAEMTSESPAGLITRLREVEGKHIWLMGGGVLLQAFRQDKMLDELMLFVIPEMLGAGIPLFPGPGKPQRWNLLDSRSYSNGVVLLHYGL